MDSITYNVDIINPPLDITLSIFYTNSDTLSNLVLLYSTKVYSSKIITIPKYRFYNISPIADDDVFFLFTFEKSSGTGTAYVSVFVDYHIE